MTSVPDPIRIVRRPGGEVDVDGVLDAFADQILRRAGFLVEPALRGHWVRLPFDMGSAWENEHATWAAEMLAAARYTVDLDPGLKTLTTTSSGVARPPAMTAQAPPPRASRR
ncbi:hypothetical protein ACFVP0_09985 [Streptomyces cinereoruber]|uniref:hypothetical protein n=1 Tax=Streptomyces cinereoruber TaxID=67260 RepID=UPI0036D14F8F